MQMNNTGKADLRPPREAGLGACLSKGTEEGRGFRGEPLNGQH